MYTTELSKKIKYFVTTIAQVYKAQLYYMFRDYRTEEVDWAVYWLKRDGYITEDGDVITSKCGIYGSSFTQKLITKAAWVLCYYGSNALIEYYISTYPVQIFFQLDHNGCYDVTAMNGETAFSAINGAMRTTAMTTTRSESGEIRDYTTHIAMYLGKGDFNTLQNHEFFDYYAVFENNEVVLKPTNKQEVLAAKAQEKQKKAAQKKVRLP